MRKKYLLAVYSAVFLLLFCSCSFHAEDSESGTTVDFYYRNYEISYDSTSGIIGAEARSVDDLTDFDHILNLYFEGPVSESLESPFPEDTEVISSFRRGNVIYLTLSQEYCELDGIRRTVADACITQTILHFTDAESVEISCVGMSEGTLLSQDSCLFESGGETDSTITLRLYFSDESSRYLLPETRKITESDTLSEAYELLQGLCAGPSDENLRAVLPEGTEVLTVIIDDGVCTVNFSEGFLSGASEGELEVRTTVFGVVDTLTELDGIRSVRFQCEGKRLSSYGYFDLSRPVSRSEEVIGPVRTGLNEFDATLFLLPSSGSKLVRIPTAVYKTANRTELEALVEALISYIPADGYENPIPAGTKLLSLTLADGTCYVDFSEDILNTGDSITEDAACVRSIVATLCARPEVQNVQILISGEAAGFTYDISEPLTAQNSWYLFPQ